MANEKNDTKGTVLLVTKFVVELDTELKAAGGIGSQIFTPEEIAKMVDVFARNNIHLTYLGVRDER